MNPPTLIAITGGPCAGKTTSLPLVAKLLEGLHLRVATLCESATLLWSCNVPFPGGSTPAHIFAWEVEKTRVQLSLENSLSAILSHDGANKRCVLLCDRGVMDVKAYLECDKIWTQLLERLDIAQETVLARYEIAVHLTSTAVDAITLYEGGGARREDAPTASKVDANVRRAWESHPRHVIVTNNGVNLAQKARQAFRHITAVLGFPVPPLEECPVAYHALPSEAISKLPPPTAVFTTVILQASSTPSDYVSLTWPSGSHAHSVLAAHNGAEVNYDVVATAAEATSMLEVRHEGCRELTRSQSRYCEGPSYVILEVVDGNRAGVYVLGAFPQTSWVLAKVCTSYGAQYLPESVTASGPNYFQIAATVVSKV